MSRSDRGERIAPIGWVFPIIGFVLATALAVFIGVLIGLSPAYPPDSNQQKGYAAAQARYAQAVAGNLSDTQANYAAYPDENQPECYNAKDHDAADLCAQWRAAIAAERSSLWTFWGFFVAALGTALSGVGLWALIYTLRQSERGLMFSRKTYEAFIALERPRLIISVSNVIASSIQFGEDEPIKRTQVQLHAANIGKSACTITAITDVWQDELPSKGGIFSGGMPQAILIPAGGEEDLGWVEGLHEDHEARHILGYVAYMSPLGEHLSYYCFIINPKATGAKHDPKWFPRREASGLPLDT